MIRIILLSTVVLTLAACNNAHSYKKAEDAEEAGTEFIRASLDGNYEKASFYLYADSTNKMMFSKWKKDYDRMGSEEQQKYKDASIRPIEIKALNDSVTPILTPAAIRTIPPLSGSSASMANGWSISRRSSTIRTK